MEYQIKYEGLNDRQKKIAQNEEKGLRMLHDNFDPDWKFGDEPHGTMVFTDELELVAEMTPIRDLAAEIDNLKARIETLENK